MEGGMFRIVLVAWLSSVSAVHSVAQGRTKPAPPAPAPAAVPALSPAAVKAFQARAIGPAVMGGRVAEIALDPQNPFTFYVGLGTGGLMKTTDSGGVFKAVFEEEAVASVGAVAVAPSDPKVVWVGTGEAN